jgi:sugar/nucleoside kinase (ribokinase family)
LFLNETEAAQFEREGLRLDVLLVVQKLGARGCSVNGSPVPGFAVEAIDTTGAGDCFAGGFLAARQRGLDPFEAARFANAAGAISTTAVGSVRALTSYEAALEWMRRR